MQTERFLEKRHVPRGLTEPVCVGVPSHQHGRQVGAQPNSIADSFALPFP
jgi:hypothetical protein